MGKTKIKEEKTEKVFPKIEFPQEIKFLDELNKRNEEKYKKWIYRKKLTEELLGKTTLILGVRGKNGIVLGSDRKIIRGGETDFGEKVRILNIKKGKEDCHIMFAAAGAVGVIEDFLEVFEKTLTRKVNEGKINSLLTIKIIAEDLVEEFEKRYSPKLGEPSLHFIFGGLSELNKGEARLYGVGYPGYGERIQYSHSIGHGRPYARTIGKYLFPIKTGIKGIPLKCNEIIPRVAACIYWISGEVDDYVGGEPQIVYILDNNPKVKEAKYKRQAVLNWVKKLKGDFQKINF